MLLLLILLGTIFPASATGSPRAGRSGRCDVVLWRIFDDPFCLPCCEVSE